MGWDCGGRWGITRSLGARACQSPCPPPTTSRDQLGTGKTPIASSRCPLSSFSLMRGRGVLMRRLLKSREVQGPPHSLALHPTRSPHIPDFVGGAPGPRLQSVFHCSIHKHSSGFQEPFRVCHSSRPWDNLLLLSGSPLPLFIWLLPPPATGLPQPLSDPVDHPAPQLSICVWPRTKLCVREGRHQSPSPQCRLPACTASPVLDTHSLSPSLHCPQSPFTLLSRSTSASPTHPESPGTRSAGPHLPPASDAPHPGSHLPLG